MRRVAFTHYCAQAGPIVAAAAQGTLSSDKMTELGEILARKEQGVAFQEWRQSKGLGQGFVIYNSVGLGIQDAAVVEFLLQQEGDRSP